MTAILRSQQLFFIGIDMKIEYARKIAMSISDIWAFDRNSSLNIDVVMRVQITHF